MKKIFILVLLTNTINIITKESSLKSDILVGSIIGATEATFPGQPLIYRMNMRLNNWPLSKNPLHWYKGIGTNVGLMAPITAMQVGLNGTLRRILKNNPDDQLSTTQKVGTAFVAGATSGIVSSVQEMVPLYQQMINKNLITHAQKIKLNESETAAYLKKHGISTKDAVKQLRSRIFSGFRVVASRDGSFVCGYLAIYESLKEKLNIKQEHNKALLGASVGVGTAMISQPLQVIKTRKQGWMAKIIELEHQKEEIPDRILKKSKYKNIFSSILKEEGIKGFFSAIKERSTRIVATSVLYALLEDKILEIVNE